MIRILCATALVISATAIVQQPAQASEAPWCLGGGYGRCYYNSLEECRGDMAGSGTFCNPNPWYRGAEQPQRQPKRFRRYSYAH
jgi:hypothetical protein